MVLWEENTVSGINGGQDGLVFLDAVGLLLQEWRCMTAVIQEALDNASCLCQLSFWHCTSQRGYVNFGFREKAAVDAQQDVGCDPAAWHQCAFRYSVSHDEESFAVRTGIFYLIEPIDGGVFFLRDA